VARAPRVQCFVTPFTIPMPFLILDATITGNARFARRISPLHPLERIFVAAIDTLVSSTQMFWSMVRTPSSHDVARLPCLRVRTHISAGKDPDGLKPGISRFSQFGCQPGIGSRRTNVQSGSTMNFIYCGYIEYGSFRQLQSNVPT
jgi:hypothetical protein